MDYKLVISEHADELLDNLVYYLLYRLKSEQAARHLLDGIGGIYDRLETNPFQFPLSNVKFRWLNDGELAVFVLIAYVG